jgi:hypothetical protein
MERRKGPLALIEAVTSLGRDDWSLTLVGEDTNTAPLGQSMRAHLELAAAGDSRIRFEEPVARDDGLRLLLEHDVLVIPALWECWPYVALEALQHGRPVLATPTGGLVEMVKPGRSGWLARDASASALTEVLGAVLDAPDELRGLVDGSAPRQVAAELSDVEELRESYASLAREARARRPARAAARDAGALVSVVVPYFQLDRYVEETLRSVVDQTYPHIEVLVVNDGSFRAEDRCLLDLSERYPITLLTQPNAGLGAARNFGISQAGGSYVFPLDADNLALPTFVERCVAVLDEDPEVAFVTSWSRFIDERGAPIDTPGASYHPLGNSGALVERHNIAGDAAAVIRREVFDRGHSYSREVHSVEDWLFYRELHRAGLFGHVIPEALLEYRVRSDSMIREVGIPELGRLTGEMAAHLQATAVRWTS